MSWRNRADSPPTDHAASQSFGSLNGLANRPFSRSSTSLASGQSPRRSGGALQSLRSLFGGGGSREKPRLELLCSPSGSIHQRIWAGLSKETSAEKRLATLKDLQESVASEAHQGMLRCGHWNRSSDDAVVEQFIKRGSSVLRNRVLQVSTLEGIYHDCKDMLADEETKEPVMRMLIELTETQFNNLGLALRHEFFEQIHKFGFGELTMKWLFALSNSGRNISGFERDCDHMVAAWVKKAVSLEDHPQALLVLQLAQELIKHNSSYISMTALAEIVKLVCIRASGTQDPLTHQCLTVLDCVLKYSDMPRGQLLYVVPVVCIQICENTFRDQAWSLVRVLLTSQMGHRTRKCLQSLLEDNYNITTDFSEAKTVRMLRGAIFCLANANWGYNQSDVVRCSPSNIIPSFEKAMSRHEEICYDVFVSIQRLIKKFGRELQQTTWNKILHLFRTALDLFHERRFERSEKLLRSQLAMAEVLYKEGQFAASHEALFDIVELAVDRWSDFNAKNLIEFRMASLCPTSSDWIQSALELVKKFSDERQPPDRRSKIIGCLHTLYTRYHTLYEDDLVPDLLLPVLQDTSREKDPKIQYQMLNVLFDVAKTVHFRFEFLLFNKVMKLIRQLLNHSVTKAMPRSDEAAEDSSSDRENFSEIDEGTTLTLDNLSIMAQMLGEVLNERWHQMTIKSLTLIVNIMVEHIKVQYQSGWFNDEGAEVREKIVGWLLSLQCCIATQRIVLTTRDVEDPARANVLIKRRHEGSDNGFSWADICRMLTQILLKDTNWSVISRVLQLVGPVLENIPFVKTAGKELDGFIEALVALYKRYDTFELVVPIEGQLTKYLPPVLAAVLNYTAGPEWSNHEICRVLVDCAAVDIYMEPIMAIDVAVQLVPEPMSSYAFRLLSILRQSKKSSERAIPLIEFMSDSAEIPEFRRLFTEEHYRSVVDLLVPYADVRKYNPYIVSCIHRILMRWYSQVPSVGNQRLNIANYIEQKVRGLPSQSLLEEMKRQNSGDGRQIPGKLFMLGGQETPPPMDGHFGKCEVRSQDALMEEIITAMSSFFKLGYIESDHGCSASLQVKHPKDKYEEVSMNHYYINETIFSVRRLVDKRELVDEEDEVFSNDGEATPTSPSEVVGSFTNTNNIEQRRRFQSARQRKNSAGHVATNALDDLYAKGGPHQHQFKPVVKRPLISYVQLTIRHMYGKSSWLVRTVDEWPDDFDRALAVPGSSSSLIYHMLNTTGGAGATRLGKQKDDEDLNRALRNLDRIFGVESHAVGVVYIGPRQETKEEILSNVYGSERYANFVKKLGDAIPLDNNPGGLVKGMHGTYTYEYRDAISSIVFLVATLMPNSPSDPQCNSKRKLIANNFVSIVFNESGEPFTMGKISGEFDTVTLEVVPVDNRNVLITVHAKQQIACWMAMRRVLLSDGCACRLLRKMIHRAQLSVNVWRSMQEGSKAPYVSLGVDRLRKIHNIRDKNASL